MFALILPLFPVGASAVLTLTAFFSRSISAAIAVDKLILLTALFSPIVYLAGGVIAVIALFNSKIKKTAIKAVLLNLVLLFVHLFLNKPLMMEFEFVI